MWSKGLFLPLERVKGANSLTSGSVTDVFFFFSFCEDIGTPLLSQTIHPGGSIIPHLEDNQQFISFPPCPYGLTGDKANKLAYVATHGGGCTERSEHMLDVETLNCVTPTRGLVGGMGVGPSTDGQCALRIFV